MTDPLHSAAAGDDADLTGQRLGDYRLVRRLGRGGMAVVYLAEQESLSRKVAFKVLRRGLATDQSYVQRFLHEAQAAAALVHANIVQIHEVGCIQGIHFIAQEYVEGQNLKQVLGREGALSVGAAVHVMRQVAAALHKAGQTRITHRDIKPENIMLARTGEVKVADFGLARVEREGQSTQLTQVGVTMGTPLYMSPEQVEGRPVDTRSDLYSFGVTCYEMLAGRPPFEGDNALSVAVQHLQKEPPRLEDARPDLPQGLCRIVHRLMAKRPEDRFQNAAELLRELRALRLTDSSAEWPSEAELWSTPELAALADSRTAATRELAAVMQHETAARPRRGPLAWAVLAVVVAALLGGLVAWVRRPAPLLRVAREELPPIERQATVRDQYLYAAGLGTEDAWLSVAKFFPPEENEQHRYYALRAEQRLAELHVARDEWDLALQCYQELVDAGEGNVQFQALGLAGQANVHILRGEQSLAYQKLAGLAQLLDRLPTELRRLIELDIHPRLRAELRRLIQDTRPNANGPRRPNNGGVRTAS